MLLTSAESEKLNALIAGVESRTGVQVVVAAVPRSDSYPELPWKAFALGASIAACATALTDWSRPQWSSATAAPIQAVVIIGAAAAAAILTVFMPPVARLFLHRARRHAEVRQYAQALFLTRELFKTRNRNAILILVSEFERRIEILPDVGLHARLNEQDWQGVIDAMTPHLRDERPVHAFEAGLAATEALLTSKGFRGGPHAANELPDRPIEERGV